MNVIAIIPARLQATRFPRKLLQDLCGAPVICRTYQAAQSTGLFKQVLVATDSKEIFESITTMGGEAVYSTKEHECGSDRIAEAATHLNADIIINVQGDEPFTNKKDLAQLIDVFKKDPHKAVALASLMHELKEEAAIHNPNNVKVVTDLDNHALYFSRSAIPFCRDRNTAYKVYKHIGIYAFRKQALMDFYHTRPSPLEQAEKIECLRYLEQGKKMKMVPTNRQSIGIDTPEDLEQARAIWKQSAVK